MNKLDRKALKKLIIETLEEESLGEAKKKEVEQEFSDTGTPVQADVAAKGKVDSPVTATAPVDALNLLKSAMEAGSDPSSDEMRKAGAAVKAEQALKQIQDFIKSLKGENVEQK